MKKSVWRTKSVGLLFVFYLFFASSAAAERGIFDAVASPSPVQAVSPSLAPAPSFATYVPFLPLLMLLAFVSLIGAFLISWKQHG